MARHAPRVSPICRTFAVRTTEASFKILSARYSTSERASVQLCPSVESADRDRARSATSLAKLLRLLVSATSLPLPQSAITSVGVGVERRHHINWWESLEGVPGFRSLTLYLTCSLLGHASVNLKWTLKKVTVRHEAGPQPRVPLTAATPDTLRLPPSNQAASAPSDFPPESIAASTRMTLRVDQILEVVHRRKVNIRRVLLLVGK